MSIAVAVVAALFTLMCLVLPEVQTPQTIIMEGPTSPYGAISYTFSGYVVPPVPAGSEISVGIAGYLPNSLALSMFPATGGGLQPTGPALIDLSNFSSSPFSVSVTAPVSGSYAIFITSENRTVYVLAIRGVWSLFYVLRGYVFEGFFAAVAGILATYYFRTWEKRKEIEEKAIRDVVSRESA